MPTKFCISFAHVCQEGRIRPYSSLTTGSRPRHPLRYSIEKTNLATVSKLQLRPPTHVATATSTWVLHLSRFPALLIYALGCYILMGAARGEKVPVPDDSIIDGVEVEKEAHLRAHRPTSVNSAQRFEVPHSPIITTPLLSPPVCFRLRVSSGPTSTLRT